MKHPAPDAPPTDALGARLSGLMRSLWQVLARPIPIDRKAAAQKRRRTARRKEEAEHLRHAGLMRDDLYQLLNKHPDSRRMMRNLYRVERLLRHDGIAGLEAAPSKILVRALDEMERLIWDWSPAGLAELRSRIAVLLKTRPVGDGLDDAASSQGIDLVDFANAHRVDVSEVAHVEFEELERSWIGQLPKPRPSLPV